MSFVRTAGRSIFALLAMGVVGGCHSQPEIFLQQPVGQTTSFESEAPPPMQGLPPPPEVADVNQGPSTAAPPAEDSLTDEKIAAILDVANGGEIDQARLAQRNASDPKVKAFAAHMIEDHGKNMADAAALMKKINVTPAESAVSAQLKQGSQDLVTKLGSEKGTGFDRAYIAAQIREHQAVLDLMDTKLLVQVKNPELKAAIQAFRPKVEHHRNEATAIQAQLAK